VRAQFFGRMNTAGSDRHHARAEVPGTGDSLGVSPITMNCSGSNFSPSCSLIRCAAIAGQIAPVKRFVAKGAGQLKEFRQPGDFHFQLRGRLDVAGE